jgi:phosphoglycolate phosphatase
VIKLLVFDLDGTLVDTRRDLGYSVNHALVQCGFPSLPLEAIISKVGDGAALLIERSLRAALNNPDTFAPAKLDTDAVLSAFLEHYQDHCLGESLPYPGVRQSLEKLRPFPMAVLTNKPLLPTTRILAGLELSQYFTWVLGGDNAFGPKPNQAALLQILTWAKAEPGQTVVIGDGIQDLRVARRAGAHFLGFLNGIGAREALLSEQPEAILEAMHFLPEAISRLANPPEPGIDRGFPFTIGRP